MTRLPGDVARSPLTHLILLAALVHLYAERLFDLLP